MVAQERPERLRRRLCRRREFHELRVFVGLKDVYLGEPACSRAGARFASPQPRVEVADPVVDVQDGHR